MNIPKIFISYHHKDESWKDRLVTHLRVLEKEGWIEVWDDRKLEVADDWPSAIKKMLNEADVALFLISANFLTSDFIRREEIPTLLKRRQQEGIVILPIILKPCAWMHLDWLRQIQVLPKDGTPLSGKTDSEIEENLTSITKRIAGILEIASTKKTRETSPTIPTTEKVEKKLKKVNFFISHCYDDGDFAELLKLRIEQNGYTAWIDIERLGIGVDWRQEIDQAIKDSSALIVVMTPKARESEYVTYEWAFAWGVGVKVIPIMLKQTQLHPRLESLQFMDFTNRAARPWSKLMDALKEAIHK